LIGICLWFLMTPLRVIVLAGTYFELP
jgi:hypothetical protein